MTFFRKALMITAVVLTLGIVSGCAGLSGSVPIASSGISQDVVTERAVLKALYAEPDLTGDQINVSCFDGVVYLNGTVDDPVDIALAERVARGIDGVDQVQNNLTET